MVKSRRVQSPHAHAHLQYDLHMAVHNRYKKRSEDQVQRQLTALKHGCSRWLDFCRLPEQLLVCPSCGGFLQRRYHSVETNYPHALGWKGSYDTTCMFPAFLATLLICTG